jgi:hypothetical protein
MLPPGAKYIYLSYYKQRLAPRGSYLAPRDRRFLDLAPGGNSLAALTPRSSYLAALAPRGNCLVTLV